MTLEIYLKLRFKIRVLSEISVKRGYFVISPVPPTPSSNDVIYEQPLRC